MTAAMVFAAGRGTRMQPLTADRPKALVTLAGRALLDHALAQVAPCDPVVVNAHHFAPMIADHLSGRPVLLSRETALLETGGGLRLALPLLGAGAVITMNADAAWTGPLAAETLLAAWDEARMDALLLLVPRARAVGPAPGSFRLDAAGRLARDPEGLVYTGAGMMRTNGLHDDPRPVFSLRDHWFAMMRAGRLFGVEHPGHWADVGTPAAIAPAARMLAVHA